MVGTGHIAVAWGRDFGDVSPLHGVILGGADHELKVSVDVQCHYSVVTVTSTVSERKAPGAPLKLPRAAPLALHRAPRRPE